MAETGLPLGAVYSGATRDALDTFRREAERSPDGYTPSAFNPETRSDVGYCRVGRNRVTVGGNKQPTSDALSKGAKEPYKGSSTDDKERRGFNIYYEVHGKGDKHIIYIMGLNNSCFGWLNQVEHFARNPNFSSMVLDNRGYGNSDTPAGPYKCVADVVSWIQSGAQRRKKGKQ